MIEKIYSVDGLTFDTEVDAIVFYDLKTISYGMEGSRRGEASCLLCARLISSLSNDQLMRVKNVIFEAIEASKVTESVSPHKFYKIVYRANNRQFDRKYDADIYDGIYNIVDCVKMDNLDGIEYDDNYGGLTESACWTFSDLISKMQRNWLDYLSEAVTHWMNIRKNKG